jgi:hypothetical protein
MARTTAFREWLKLVPASRLKPAGILLRCLFPPAQGWWQKGSRLKPAECRARPGELCRVTIGDVDRVCVPAAISRSIVWTSVYTN